MFSRLAIGVAAVVVMGFIAPAHATVNVEGGTLLYAQDFETGTVGNHLNTLPFAPPQFGAFSRPVGPPPSDIFISATTITSGQSAEAFGDGEEHTLAGFLQSPFVDIPIVPGELTRLTAALQFSGTEAKGGYIVGQTQGGGPQYAAGWHIGFDMTGLNHHMLLNQRDPDAAHGGNPGDCGACLGTNLATADVDEAALEATAFEVRLDILADSSAQGFYRTTPGSGPWLLIGSLPMVGGRDIATTGVDYAMLTATSTGNTVLFDDVVLAHFVPEPTTLTLLSAALPLLVHRRTA